MIESLIIWLLLVIIIGFIHHYMIALRDYWPMMAAKVICVFGLTYSLITLL